MSKILLTGHRGLLGSAIANEVNVETVDGYITDVNDLSFYLKEGEIDTIIHAAAKVGGVLHNTENKVDYWLQNTKLNNIILEAALEQKIKKIINFSSTCVFPANCEYPLKEEYMHNGAPHESNNAYAYAKRMMQFMCSELRDSEREFFTIVPTNIFGPNDNFNLYKGHVLPALIHKCYLAKNKNEDLVIWGSGEPLREFVFSKDLAKITKKLLEIKTTYDSIIVSNSKEISIRECAEIVSKAMGFKGNIIFDKSKPDGQFRKPTDTTRFKSVFPDFVFSDFNESLNETVDWFLTNYNNLKK
jgi:GDP-L-fucose synthase